MRLENSFIFVTGVGETTERRLWERGITHWETFDRSTAPRLGPCSPHTIEEHLDEARTALEVGDSRFFDDRLPSRSRWRIYEDFRDDACFLDIETTGLDASRDVVTTVSVHRNGETTTLVRDRDLTADRLATCVEDASLLVTFNGARFDVPFLERRFDLSIDVPHLDLLYPSKRVGLTGGLKRIERTLGIDRPNPDVDGREAVRLWYRYESGDDGALDRLVEYNRRDTTNLEDVADRIVSMLDRDVFEPYRPTA